MKDQLDDESKSQVRQLLKNDPNTTTI